MTQTFDFYDQRARAAEAEADKSALANVRERELRSARAWREMADRQLKIDSERVKADAERSARRAAEREALEDAVATRPWETAPN
jgi:hypothetical protein